MDAWDELDSALFHVCDAFEKSGPGTPQERRDFLAGQLAFLAACYAAEADETPPSTPEARRQFVASQLEALAALYRATTLPPGNG